MANPLRRGFAAVLGTAPPVTEIPRARNTIPLDTLAGICDGGVDVSAAAAMKLSAVDRCVEVLSGDIAKLPAYVFDRKTRLRVEHPVLELLNMRAGALQTAFDARKIAEAGRICGGNGYLWIWRDPHTLRPVQLIGVPWDRVRPHLDSGGAIWYDITSPFTQMTTMNVHQMDVVHVPAFSRNGWKGVSYLERASEVVAASRAAQQYNTAYYLNGGQPGGVLETDSNLEGTVDVTDNEGTTTAVRIKDIIRGEWEKRHGGPFNANRVAVLDNGLKYHPLSISQRDAQFVESAELSIRDLARFFGVPLYKLQEGKQSYNSNEQNAIEYITGTLHPIVTAWEQELSYKLLTRQELDAGLEIRLNMMAELRGDSAARGTWYKAMREAGAYSVNDLRDLEDMPDVEGGDEHMVSLNYVPLSLWRELSITRNGGKAT